MLWPREWLLLGSAFALLVVFTLWIDSQHEWQFVVGVDRAARSWLQSVVCDRAVENAEESP